MHHRIRVKSLDKRFKHLEKPLREIALGVFRFMRLKKTSFLDVYLINSRRMAVLNHKYRGKGVPTDVLSVEYPSSFPQTEQIRVLGEIYLSPTYLRNNKSYSLDLALIHGTLHLLGFNHRKKSDKMEMEKLEKEILRWLKRTF
ncbi:MAG: rRNA maturation RNase YbeY [Candidatus Colwellbacteria bacterium RBG_13_48_8]|uniref:Endoribonuclease YbeY n=1 Tax=Candidatus Colwellbacteria bacterium RBG_13_48_8 TaxID=1797685 RepID=A0A1G1YX68_9BACT|nr:MAG: rRNA maturation RNase YbeY [Candidatus Colwellbacteria bacterium RBG_13_48_8]